MELAKRLQGIYSMVTPLDCSGCSGDCCVSPTMTAPEFVVFMQNAQQTRSTTALEQIISVPLRVHPHYEGNAFCRFQLATGPCDNYQGRALACRLFGHEVLREYAVPNMEFCTRNPPGNRNLQAPTVDAMLAEIRQLMAAENLEYSAPFFMESLSLECWLDFYFNPELCANRPSLTSLRNYLDAQLQIPRPPAYPIHTNLAQKMVQIEVLHQQIAAENGSAVLEILHSLLNDYPTCGSYYLSEAQQILDIITPKE